jgi:hypothetical protein
MVTIMGIRSEDGKIRHHIRVDLSPLDRGWNRAGECFDAHAWLESARSSAPTSATVRSDAFDEWRDAKHATTSANPLFGESAALAPSPSSRAARSDVPEGITLRQAATKVSAPEGVRRVVSCRPAARSAAIRRSRRPSAS